MESNLHRSSRGLVKVMFVLEPGAWHGSATETLWAEPLGAGRYRLKNSPFYAFDVSFQDIVLAQERGGSLVFIETIERGGHSTYRLIVKAERMIDLERYWSPMQAMGCTYEEGLGGLLAVDVPADTDIFKVYAMMEAGERAGVWSFEEGHCGHAVA